MKKIFYLNIIFLLMSFISCNTSSHNKNTKSKNFRWAIAGHIPDNPDGSASLGLAGPVAGISHNKLIIGGGSNFPDGAPWEGGNKVYYNRVYVFKKEGDSVISIKSGLHLPYHVAYSANCPTDKGLVVAGGENEKGALDKVLLNKLGYC